MGVYERVEGKEVNGRGLWQAVGGIAHFLHFYSSTWLVSSRENMEAGNGQAGIGARSTATTLDQITGQWKVHDGKAAVNAPNLRVRVCSSVEKHAAEQRVEQVYEQAMVQTKQVRPVDAGRARK
jgi:hypothetical protein